MDIQPQSVSEETEVTPSSQSEKSFFSPLLIFLILLLVVAILGVSWFLYYFLSSSDDVAEGIDKATIHAVTEGELDSNFHFETERLEDKCTGEGIELHCDVRLVRVNENGQKVIVEENITQNFRDFQNSQNPYLTIEKLYFPVNSENLFFKAFIAQSSGCCALYIFNVPNQTFSRPLNVWYSNPSPSKTKMVRIGDDGKTIELANIIDDTVRTIQLVNGDETLINFVNSYDASVVGNLKWLDENRIEYGVFEKKSLDTLEGIEPREPLETRIVELF